MQRISNKIFICLLLIALFGLGLRLINYDRIPPFGETRDEFFYPRAGRFYQKMPLFNTIYSKVFSTIDNRV